MNRELKREAVEQGQNDQAVPKAIDVPFTMGRGVVQRKIARRALQRKPANGLQGEKSTSPADAMAVTMAIKQRLMLLLKQANAGGKGGAKGPAMPKGEGQHIELAKAVIKHCPGALLLTQDAAHVSLDVSKTEMWKKDDTHFLAHSHHKFFTGNGVFMFFANCAGQDLKELRWVLEFEVGMGKDEIAQICDNWLERQCDALGSWITSFDSESQREAPAAIQFIADMNPLVILAKVISACQGTDMYSGKAITDEQKVEVAIQGVFAAFSVLGAASGAVENVMAKMMAEDPLLRELELKLFEIVAIREAKNV